MFIQGWSHSCHDRQHPIKLFFLSCFTDTKKRSVVLSSGLSSGLFIIAMGHQRLFIFRSPVLIFGRVLSLHVLLTFGPVRFPLFIFLSPSELPSATFLVAPQCQVMLYVDVGYGLRLWPCLTAISETVDQPDIRVWITLINLSRLTHMEKALASWPNTLTS